MENFLGKKFLSAHYQVGARRTRNTVFPSQIKKTVKLTVDSA